MLKNRSRELFYAFFVCSMAIAACSQEKSRVTEEPIAKVTSSEQPSPLTSVPPILETIVSESVTGKEEKERFTDNKNGTVTDYKTGLMWQKTDDGLGRAAGGAKDYCAELALDGYKNWRVPTKDEFKTIIIKYNLPTINKKYFPKTEAVGYWTADVIDANTSNFSADGTWAINFFSGESVPLYNSNSMLTRCVRNDHSVKTSVINSTHNNLIDNGDDTIKDTKTGLVWQKQDNGKKMPWEKAESYCKGLNLGNNEDWRLPRINELETLIDSNRANPAINTKFFPRTKSSIYWSANTSLQDSRGAWGVHFEEGGLIDWGKTGLYYTRCVR